MRVLFAFAGGRGHAQPLVPIARAAAVAGHTVAFTGKARIVAALEELGFTVFPSGPGGSDPPKRVPLRRLDPEKEDRDLGYGFARIVARRRAADVLALCAEWRPDVVVCDEFDFGATVAAERLDLPYATVLVNASGSFVRPAVVAELLDEVRAWNGLAADPDLQALRRYLVLSPFPPSFRDPAFPLPPTGRCFRAETAMSAARDRTPTVYFTLGTVFNVESGDLFTRVLGGLAELGVNVVATVGWDIDPAELGPFPESVRLERYVPQSLILPECDAVVSHGGSGSVLGALAHGLPSVLLPMGADQPLNAARCEALGAGLVLDAVDATSEDLREAVSAVLGDASYRTAAELVREEIASMPGPEDALEWLEPLVRSAGH